MVMNITLSSWEFLLVCLMAFISFCFWQYKRSQQAEVITRTYGRREPDITEIHNHFYGYDQETMASLAQMKKIYLPDEDSQVVKRRIQKKVEESNVVEVNVELDDELMRVAGNRPVESSPAPFTIESPPDISQSIPKATKSEEINTNNFSESDFVTIDATIPKPAQLQVVSIRDDERAKSLYKDLVVTPTTVNTSTDDYYGSVQREEVSLHNQYPSEAVVNVDVKEPTTISNIESTSKQNDENFASLYQSYEEKMQKKDDVDKMGGHFWGIDFDQINSYIQVSDIINNPEVYQVSHFPIVGKVTQKQIANKLFYIQIADQTGQIWAIIDKEVFDSVRQGTVIALHEVVIDDVKTKLVKQISGTEFIIFANGNERARNQDVG